MVNGFVSTTCPQCGHKIIVEKLPYKIRYKCEKCGASYGCDLRGDRK